MSKQRGVNVVITEHLSCGHPCEITYPMEEDHTLTLITGPLTSIKPSSVFPDLSLLLPLLDRTLELSGKYGHVKYTGITVRDGRFTCAECGALLLQMERKP